MKAAFFAAFVAIFIIPTNAVTIEMIRKFHNRLNEQNYKIYLQNPNLYNSHIPAQALEDSEDVHPRSKRQIFSTCPPGFTGTYCESPLCSNPQQIGMHDGMSDAGEIIFNGNSIRCGSGDPENYTVPIDVYLGFTTVQIETVLPGGFPGTRLFSPNGTRVVPDSYVPDQNGKWETTTYNNLVSTFGPGTYRLQINAIDNIPCSFSILSRTPMVVDGGFVQNVTDDAVQKNFMTATKGVERNPLVYSANWLGFKPFNLQNPGQAQVVTFYKGGAMQYTPYNTRYRYNCNAYDYAGPYLCTEVTGIYHLIVSGLDHTGNIFQRMYLYECDSQGTGTYTAPPVTGTGTPATQAPPLFCYNGGTLTNTSGTLRCYCGQFFEGYQCENKKCFNDGRVGPNGVCACVPGYTGTFCEHVQCTHPNMGDFNTGRASLAFVIRGTTSMQSAWNDLYRAANNVITVFNDQAPGFLQNFVLIIFANGNITNIVETTDSNAFLLAIDNQRNALVPATACLDSVYTGISAALSTDSMAMYKRSPIYVWSDSLPNDGDAVRANLYGQIGRFRGQIFISFPQGTNDSCYVDETDQGYRGLRRLASYSQGLVNRENSSDLTQLSIYTASAIRNAVHLATNDLIDQCSYAPNYQSFFVDESVGNVYVFAYGNTLTIVVNGPNRKVVTPFSSVQLGNTYIQLYQNLWKGNYLITVSSGAKPTGPCAYRVIGNANTNAFIATSTALDVDMTSPYGLNPIYKQDNYMVAHINNLREPSFTGIMAELTIWTNEAPNRTRTMIYASNGHYRDSCDYHFEFGQWNCPRPNLLFYASIYVEDGTGYIMQRVVTGMCVTQQLCAGNCNGCQNGGVPDPRNNSTCLCPPGYNGAQCQNIQCQNGGTPNVYDCLCSDGWSGLFCERPVCITADWRDNFSPNGKSIAFLIHNSISTRNVLQKMQAAMPQTLQEIQQQHPTWINNYKLVAFSDVGAPAGAADTSNPDDFLLAFKNLVNVNQQNNAFSCKSLRVAESIYLTLKSVTTTQYGVIYVFLTGLPNINNTVLYEINEMLQVSHTQVNFVQGSAMPCGASLSDPAMRILFNIAASTGGTVYLANQDFSGDALHTTPANYAKSYVYQNFVPDCSNRSNFYFPVESETQTMQVQIFGDLDDSPSNPAVVYTPSDPTSIPNIVKIYNDIGSNARVDEILKPCDKGWKLYDHSCWFFDYNQKSWIDAWETCVTLGGILPTLYTNKTEQDFFFEINNSTAWIGLTDEAQLGVWMWAQIDGANLSLSNTGYTNWGQNMPINDSTKRCVSDQKSNGWQVEDCFTTHFYACVKNVYDYKNVFEGENANFLPSGMWTVSVKTYKDPGGPPAPCEVKVYSQSGIRAFLGYSFNVHSDLDTFEPYQDSNRNYFVSHVQSISKTDLSLLRLMYAHFYVTDNMQMIGVQQFTKRDTGSCNWEYVSTAFQCPGNASSTAFHPYLTANTSAFQTALTGIDYAGHLFQRIRPTVCHIRNPLQNCDNGGVYDKTRQQCICAPDWYGDRCEFPSCYNGGTLDQVFYACQCPAIPSTGGGQPPRPLYSGDHCEFANCVRGGNNGLPLPITTNKTFVLVLDGSGVGLMGDVLTNINTILTNITQFVPGVFTSYVAVIVRDMTFNVSNYPPTSPVFAGTNLSAWIAEIQAELAKTAYNSTTIERLLLTGLNKILNDLTARSYIQPQSQVFVLTGGVASAIDADREHAVQDLIAPLQLAVNFIYVGDMGPPGNIQDPGRDLRTRSLYELSYITGGGFYQVHNTSNLVNFWFVVLAHRLNSFYIQSSRNFNCTNHFEYFQVGSSNTKLLFDVYVSNSPSISVTSNNGSQVAVQALTRSNSNYLFSLDVLDPGTWKFNMDQNVTNAGFCAVTIKGVDNQNQVSWAFTQDTSDGGAHTNDAVLYPDGRNESRNAILVSIPMGYGMFVQIYDVFERTLLWSSPLVRRHQCTYNHISAYQFRSCPAEQFMLAVEGYDTAMNPYRRVGMVHCVNYHGV